MKSFVFRYDVVWGRHFECLLCGRVFGLPWSESGTRCPCGAPDDVEEGAIVLERLSRIGRGTTDLGGYVKEITGDYMGEALRRRRAIGEKGAR